MDQVLLICTNQYLDTFKKIIDVISQASKTTLITNEKELSLLLKENKIKQYNLCIIQPELTWQDWYPTQYRGFRIAKVLRRHGLVAYIYFPTLQPPSHFYFNDPQFSLLRASMFHKVVTLPITKENKKEIVAGKLTPEQWEDINMSLLSIRALVRSLMHDFKNELYGLTKISHEKKLKHVSQISRQYFANLEEILPEEKGQLERIHQALRLLFKKNIEEEKKPLYEVVEELAPEIINLAPYDEEDEANQPKLLTPWKVLLVEDEPPVAAIFVAAFKRNNIQYVTTTSGKEVLELLKEDSGVNHFTALVCDIRLKEPDSEIWQPYQGYDLIREIRTGYSNQIALFSVTSAKSLLVHLARNFQGNISIEYKNDILSSDGALNLFCRKIREAGDDFFFRARSRPNLSAWNKPTKRFFKPLADFYRIHLFALDYRTTEDNINQQTSEFVTHCIEGTSPREETGFTITIKDTAGQTEEDHLAKFRYFILLGRRIALSLFYKGYSEDEIYDWMQPNAANSNSKASKDQLFKTTLAISFQKDLPQLEKIEKGLYLNAHLLLEELIYLQDVQQVDFDLEKLRLTLRDRDIVWYILSDARYTLEHRSQSLPPKFADHWQTLSKLENNALAISSIKEAKSMLALIKDLAVATKNWKLIKEMIKDQLGDVESEILRNYLEGSLL